MDALLSIVVIGGILFIILVIGWIIYAQFNRSSRSSKSGRSYKAKSLDDRLPNGYTRKDYHEAGIPDSAIDLWGLDEPNAPDPGSAGFIIADIADGKFDGKLPH